MFVYIRIETRINIMSVICIIMSDMAFKRLYITLPPDTLEKLEKTAKEKGRSKSNMIAYLIEQYK